MAGSTRVLYVIDSLAPGGAETSFASMAPHLIERGIDLHVAYFHERDGVGDELRRAGATLHHVEGGRLRRIRELRVLLRSLDVDLVHTTLFEADQAGRTAALLTRRRVVTSYVSTTFELGSWRTTYGRRARAALVVDATTARFAKGFHAVSKPVAEMTARRLRLSEQLFTVIPRGREPDALGRRSVERRRAVRGRLHIGDDVPIVLAIGRHVVPKGQMTLVDALPEVLAAEPEVQVLLAGQRGSESAALERRIDELDLGGHIRLLGHRDDVADLLAAADVLAHPSTREGFPGTLVEALALECPIVASDIAAIRSVVDAAAGMLAVLVPPGQPSALAAGVLQLLRAPPDEATVQAGRLLFEEQYTTAAVSARMADFYAGFTDGAPGRMVS